MGIGSSTGVLCRSVVDGNQIPLLPPSLANIEDVGLAILAGALESPPTATHNPGLIVTHGDAQQMA